MINPIFDVNVIVFVRKSMDFSTWPGALGIALALASCVIEDFSFRVVGRASAGYQNVKN